MQYVVKQKSSCYAQLNLSLLSISIFCLNFTEIHYKLHTNAQSFTPSNEFRSDRSIFVFSLGKLFSEKKIVTSLVFNTRKRIAYFAAIAKQNFDNTVTFDWFIFRLSLLRKKSKPQKKNEYKKICFLFFGSQNTIYHRLSSSLTSPPDKLRCMCIFKKNK